MKKEMRSYNLNQLLEHLLSIIRHQQAKLKKNLKAYIKAGCSWSKDVDDLWKGESNSASEYDAFVSMNRTEFGKRSVMTAKEAST